MAQLTYTLKLISAEKITPFVKHFVFSREDGTVPRYQPGQFITLHIPVADGKKVHRSYSVANAPSEENRLELSAAYVEGGIASTLLFNLQPGETVTAIGPHGLFVLKEEKPKRYILIATGTGVTPYRSMLSTLAQRLSNKEEPLSVHLILGVRTREEALFKDEFLAFAEKFPNFHFHVAYSREKDESLDATFESTGYVQDQLQSLALNPQEDIVYLCGNPGMIDTTFTQLTEQYGFDRKMVRREKYAFAH
ncbi:MAG: Ferredoxin--NADP reductase [Pseudomonadota bacterium]|jgi:ferredoxin-NADP reductase